MITTAINNLKTLEPLKIVDIKNWLDKYEILYNKSVLENKYSEILFLHCQKEEKSENHLFQDIYSTLKSHVNDLENNLILEKQFKTELEKYNLCKNNSLELKKWLQYNLEAGLQIYLEFDYDNRAKILEEVQFAINKTTNKNFTLLIDNECSFDSLYLFSKIFVELFFEKKILPNEYESWKKKVGFEEV
ncbi:hypothetical protein PG593_07530 [Riemerella anatipestifer]|uniref:hypothetical protein n=1 Tax=Riemerella anatipestifer TaxID=34085 RepID=UPI002858F398|nr:hypothetical protein [Riemerella anatipestifer]MDR7830856.1 hypothetical protein [Riemerella anatipestifer]MDY3529628.1 hypothetical protein [Riemerella anatipestifer]